MNGDKKEQATKDQDVIKEEHIKNIESLVQGIDRELAFYRKRAGQVFFLGLLVEGLLLTEKVKIAIEESAHLVIIKPFVYSLLFIAVAAIGIALGYEYRQRIHALKEKRNELCKTLSKLLNIRNKFYPQTGGIKISEIFVLYIVLYLLSTSGVILVWFNAWSKIPDNDNLFICFILSIVILLTILSGIFLLLLYGEYKKKKEHKCDAKTISS